MSQIQIIWSGSSQNIAFIYIPISVVLVHWQRLEIRSIILNGSYYNIQEHKMRTTRIERTARTERIIRNLRIRTQTLNLTIILEMLLVLHMRTLMLTQTLTAEVFVILTNCDPIYFSSIHCSRWGMHNWHSTVLWHHHTI